MPGGAPIGLGVGAVWMPSAAAGAAVAMFGLWLAVQIRARLPERVPYTILG